MQKETPLISAENISFGYEQGTYVIRGVSLQIHRGEKFVVVGPNGAGKTTLANLLVGALTPQTGRIVYRPDMVRGRGRMPIGYVRQQLSVFPTLTVRDHFRLLEPAQNGAFAGGPDRLTPDECLQQVGARFGLKVTAEDLPFSSRQLLEIALALWRRTYVLILDEPTSALDRHSVDALFRALDNLAHDGVAIVLISHDPGEIQRLEANCVVLGDPSVDFSPHGRERRESQGKESTDEPVVNVPVQLGHGRQLTVPLRGGVAALLVFDDAYWRSVAWGYMALHEGHGVPNMSRTVNAGIRSISSDRERFGVFPVLSVWQNYLLLARERNVWPDATRQANVNEIFSHYSIMMPSWQHPMSTLSGGNQQKLVLASVLSSRPETVIAEEPMLGLDQRSRANVVECLCDFLRRGGRLILFTCFHEAYGGIPADIIPVSTGAWN